MPKLSRFVGTRPALNLRSEAGVSLVEVLAAIAILGVVLLPMLDFAAYMYNGQAYERQLAATLAAAKLEELQNAAYRSGTLVWPPSVSDESVMVGNLGFVRSWTVSEVDPTWNPERNYLRQVDLRVWCANCRKEQPVRVVTYIAKLNPWAETQKLPDPME